MSTSADEIKQNTDIVEFIGRYVTLKQHGREHTALCPLHEEKTASFRVHEDKQTFFCDGCGKGGSVIDFVMELKSLTFPEACKDIAGETASAPVSKPKPRQPEPEPEKPTVIKLTPQATADHFTKEVMQDAVDVMTTYRNKPAQHYVQGWVYRDEEGLTELVAARFETEDGKKDVLSFYYNGHSLKMKNYPVLLYNRDRLHNEPEKDVLIVFGEKCAKIADEIGFIGVTWNGGEKKIHRADLSPLKNRTCYLWEDDDEPGRKCGDSVREILPHVQTVTTLKELRKIEPKSADIAEAVDYFESEQAIVDYIYNNSTRTTEPEKRVDVADDPDNYKMVTADVKTQPVSTTGTTTESGGELYPFKVLGIGEDAKAYFIGVEDRLVALNPTTISKGQLYNLMDVDAWRGMYDGCTRKEQWEDVISDLIQASLSIDFDVKRFRGRGAWRESDGRICYYDGKKISGQYDDNRIFLRRPRVDIGISDKHATKKQRQDIFKIASQLTFRTMADCVRVLGWSALAPFSGALKWRPCVFITAGSGTGKSTILNLIIKPLSSATIWTGIDTTAPGIRQNAGSDSCAIVIEEAEAKDKKSKQNRNEIFGLMRQSTSDDAPKAAKGTSDGKGITYEMSSMFAFLAINPVIDGEADEKRTARIDLVKANENRVSWIAKEKQVKAILTDKVCRGVRAFTWSHLENIFAITERVAERAQIVANVDNRTAYADSLLLAAFIVVFDDQPNPTDDYLDSMVKQIYADQVVEKTRDESEELLKRLLDSKVRDGSAEYTVRELCSIINPSSGYTVGSTEVKNAKSVLSRNGLGLTTDNDIAISKGNKSIVEMLEEGYQYHMILNRHPKLKNNNKSVYLGGAAGTCSCVIIGMDDDVYDESED